MTAAAAPAPRRVVVGVDGSESSARAAVFAAEEARRHGLPLLVVHVTPWRAGGDAVPVTSAEAQAQFRASAVRLVEAAADHVRQWTGMAEVSVSVVDDHPVDGLLALSAEAALLVIGERGAGGLSGVLLGSTAAAVVQHARCPVIALPDDWQGSGNGQGPVVVGVDGRPGVDEVLAVAVAGATSRGTDLVVLHAWHDAALEVALGRYGGLVDWDAVVAERRRHLAALVAPWRTRAAGIEIREVVVRERPAAALRNAAVGAQLLVVGHRPRGVVARLGSTTLGVLHRAACPVAVVPLRPDS
ncbi:universal stress protein [Geodermatophilus sabuli]|uniref:Nucleotide-binding universal stress protein, UspA family n=1 Tax=Geodermatophilus sabuli TaxID=1564158 RepID=A0A285EBZ6_9ACTN|nr:universal stress protein [Geodermatophilus sabuli]MBB3084358.1 nucleotide-binding universal stress UspA family protein [Geodermatophilus sabuli]SNX96373.1 Nucleotide-binding universal stress protein, UspA family [Geodermatophilus sabuli]